MCYLGPSSKLSCYLFVKCWEIKFIESYYFVIYIIFPFFILVGLFILWLCDLISTKAKASTVHRPRSNIKSLVIGPLVFQHEFPDREELQHTSLPPLCHPSASKLASILSSKRCDPLKLKVELFPTHAAAPPRSFRHILSIERPNTNTLKVHRK